MNQFKNNISFSKESLQYFMDLSPEEKILYFFSAYNNATHQTDNNALNEFFESVNEDYVDYDDFDEYAVVPSVVKEYEDASGNVHTVSLVVDEYTLMLEADNEEALHSIQMHYVEMGYILKRDLETEELFSEDKTTKYMVVYEVLGIVDPLCLN